MKNTKVQVEEEEEQALTRHSRRQTK